jgi:hypothetical protein
VEEAAEDPVAVEELGVAETDPYPQQPVLLGLLELEAQVQQIVFQAYLLHMEQAVMAVLILLTVLAQQVQPIEEMVAVRLAQQLAVQAP